MFADGKEMLAKVFEGLEVCSLRRGPGAVYGAQSEGEAHKTILTDMKVVWVVRR